MAKKPEVVKETVKEEPKVVKVHLKADKPSGIHTIFMSDYRVEFVNGEAEVTEEVAKELRKHGYIK